MMAGYDYDYGMGKPTMGRPRTIADEMEDRRRRDIMAEQAYQRQQQQAMDYRYETAMQDRAEAAEMRKNRLGLGTLDSMLADRGSAAYQNTYSTGAEDRDGNPIYQTAEEMGIPSVQIDIAPIGEGPKAAPLGLSPLRNMSMRREVRPEYEEAQAALRPKNSLGSSRITLDEYEKRKAADVRAAQDIDTHRTQNDLSLRLTDAELDAIMQAHSITAKDLMANKPEVAAKLQQAVADFVARKQGGQKLDLGGGADTGVPVDGNGDELQVEVAPVEKTPVEQRKTSKGTYVKYKDGTVEFIRNDGTKVPVNGA